MAVMCQAAPLPVTQETGSILSAPAADLSQLRPLPRMWSRVFGAAFNSVEATSPSSSWWNLQPLSLAAGRESHAPLLSLSAPTTSANLHPSLPLLLHPRSCKTFASAGEQGGAADSGSQEWSWAGEEAPPGCNLKERKRRERGLTWWGRQRELPLTCVTLLTVSKLPLCN